MKNYPKFNIKNPEGKEQKLIVELINSLDETTDAFMKLNHTGNVTQEIFVILRDASIGYTGGMVRDLTKLIDNKKQQMSFLDEAKKLYDAYMNEIEEKICQ